MPNLCRDTEQTINNSYSESFSETTAVEIVQATPAVSQCPKLGMRDWPLSAVALAFITILTNSCNNYLFYDQLRHSSGLSAWLDKKHPNLSNLITTPVIIFFIMNTVIVFIWSVLPALTQHKEHENNKVNKTIKQIKNILGTDLEYPSPEVKDHYVILYWNKLIMEKRHHLSDHEFDEIVEGIKDISLNKERIIVITSVKGLQNFLVSDSLPNYKANLVYANRISSDVKRHLLKKFNLIDLESTYTTLFTSIPIKYIPALITLFLNFLGGNHTVKDLFGDDTHWNQHLFRFTELCLFLLAATKSHVNYKRKFCKAEENWDAFKHYMLNCKGKYRVSWKKLPLFALKVLLPGSCALFTFSVASFASFKWGCMQLFIYTIYKIFNKTGFDFDPTAVHPAIPDYQIKIAYAAMLISCGTILLNNVPSLLSQFRHGHSKSSTTQKIKYKKTWKFVRTAIFIDAFLSQLLVITSGNLTFINYLLGEETSLKSLLPSLIIASGSAFSYESFQLEWTKKTFNKSCEDFISLKDFILSYLKGCQHTSQTENLEDSTTTALLENGILHHSYQSTTQEAPRSERTRNCVVM